MRTISRNQRWFAVVATMLSVTFMILLYRFLDAKQYSDIAPLAVGFGVAMFLAGLGFGAKDPVAGNRRDLGFGYHAITFVVVSVVGLIAAVLNGQELWTQVVGLVGWAIGLGVHYLVSRRTLKGMSGDEVFP